MELHFKYREILLVTTNRVTTPLSLASHFTVITESSGDRKKNNLPYVFLLVKAYQLQTEGSQTLQDLQDEPGSPQPQ